MKFFDTARCSRSELGLNSQAPLNCAALLLITLDGAHRLEEQFQNAFNTTRHQAHRKAKDLQRHLGDIGVEKDGRRACTLDSGVAVQTVFAGAIPPRASCHVAQSIPKCFPSCTYRPSQVLPILYTRAFPNPTSTRRCSKPYLRWVREGSHTIAKKSHSLLIICWKGAFGKCWERLCYPCAPPPPPPPPPFLLPPCNVSTPPWCHSLLCL